MEIFGRRYSTFTVCLVMLLVSLFILLLTCFAAVTYDSAKDKYDSGKKALGDMAAYCEAGSIASDIISDFHSKKISSATMNGIETVDTENGEVEVIKIDDEIYFSVPLGRESLLSVGAEVTDSSITITRWYTETAGN